MSIETKLARAMSELDERGVLVLQDPEIDTIRIAQVGRGWHISHRYHEYDDYLVTKREQVEKTIRSWLKCQEHIDSL